MKINLYDTKCRLCIHISLKVYNFESIVLSHLGSFTAAQFLDWPAFSARNVCVQNPFHCLTNWLILSHFLRMTCFQLSVVFKMLTCWVFSWVFVRSDRCVDVILLILAPSAWGVKPHTPSFHALNTASAIRASDPTSSLPRAPQVWPSPNHNIFPKSQVETIADLLSWSDWLKRHSLHLSKVRGQCGESGAFGHMTWLDDMLSSSHSYKYEWDIYFFDSITVKRICNAYLANVWKHMPQTS